MPKQSENHIVRRFRKMSLFQTFISFIKVGIIGFGGGSALIPVIESEIVESRQAMDDQIYLKHTVVANITPGALPVKLGATIGYQLKGLTGALVASYSVMLPGVVLTILLLSLFAGLNQSVFRYISYASLGITAYIIFLLVHFVIKTVRPGQFRISLALCLGAFALTGGMEVRQLLARIFALDVALLGVPLLDISTIDLMIATFFVIIILERLRGEWELLAVLALALLYSLAGGRAAGTAGMDQFKPVVLAAMGLVLVLTVIFRRQKKEGKTDLRLDSSAVLTIAAFLSLPVILAAAAHFAGLIRFSGENLAFMGRVLLSTVTSFGGGEACVAVAEGIFTQLGHVEADLFFTRLVPVANALPGPILIKIAAGIGYTLGLAMSGHAGGWALGILAAAAALGACCAIAILVLRLYESIGQSAFVRNLKRYILPVICGMLLSTCSAMIYESVKIADDSGIAGIIAFPALIALVTGIWYLHQRFHLPDILLLIQPAGLTLGVMLMV